MSSQFFSISRFLIIFSCVLFFASCGGNDGTAGKTKNTDGEKISADESSFIEIADASKIDPSWSKENVLVYHDIGEPDDMHPTNGLSAQRNEINGYTQVYLIGTDYQNLTVRPIAVKALPVVSENGKEYTYDLRSDIKFDDGSVLSMEDVIFTFKANKCPLTNNPHAKPYLDNLVDIRIDPSDNKKFTIVMKEKYIQNISFLTDYPIMQRTFFDKNNVLSNYTFAQFNDKTFKADQKKDLNDWGTEFNNAKYSRDPKFIVGAGQYRMEKWDPGQSITLVRKENHWTKGSTNLYETSYPDKIIFKINKDANSSMLEFKSQAMDASTFLSTKTLMDLQNDAGFNANYNSRFTDTYNYGYIAMNMKPDGVKHKKLFTDKSVRRAMAMLAPLDDINKVVNKGKNRRMVGPVSPLKKGAYNNDLKLIAFDIEGAKKILDAAGWKDTDGDNIRDKMIDGEKVKMEFNLNYMTTLVDWKDIAQMVSEQMYKAGVKANITPLDFAVLYDNAKNHDFDMTIAAWAGNFAPEDFTQIWHTASWASKGSNFPGFGTSESDALIDSIKYTLDDAKRNEMVKKLQAIIYNEQPYIFMFAALRRNVIHKRFGNQQMYFERPGVWLSNLRLLSNPGTASTPSAVN
ncbi:MAG: ABC transporter substrate-binding protein [Bacteroidota bacterium]|nr:ABC transporter substrate-binding protein [Bacteroidota bacterium]